jgi:hypothetical protein
MDGTDRKNIRSKIESYSPGKLNVLSPGGILNEAVWR